VEIIVTGIFGVSANCRRELMKVVFRHLVKLAHIVKPLDEHPHHHQGQYCDMISLAFDLHAALHLRVDSIICSAAWVYKRNYALRDEPAW